MADPGVVRLIRSNPPEADPKPTKSNKATQIKYSVSRPIGYSKAHKGHG